jgi:hypothetical protein
MEDIKIVAGLAKKIKCSPSYEKDGVVFTRKEVKTLVRDVLTKNKVIIKNNKNEETEISYDDLKALSYLLVDKEQFKPPKRSVPILPITIDNDVIGFFSEEEPFAEYLDDEDIKILCDEKVFTRTVLLKMLDFYISIHNLTVEDNTQFFKLDNHLKKYFGNIIERIIDENPNYEIINDERTFSKMGLFSLVSKISKKYEGIVSEESKCSISNIIFHIDEAKKD